MNEYDIGKALAAIEEELIASMMRNMQYHRDWEDAEGFQWSMWQAEQLKALNKYKKANKKKFQKSFNEINSSIEHVIKQARKQGNMEQELEILDAIKHGWKAPENLSKSAQTSAEFFKLNTRKLDALIKATEHDFKKAEVAMLRRANDQYRQVIFNAQVYANTGAGTYEKAVDMATKDFLAAGINCIEYANGARHTVKDYADMAIRTASKRAYLTGEGEKRQEWGISTVIINKRGNPCPKCLPFTGKIMIDDVWSGGKASDGPYPLMSSAIAAGLYHPRCKDSHTTYFPGISSAPDERYSKNEIRQIEQENREEQKKLYAARQAEKYKRLANNSLDEDNKEKYVARADEWNTSSVENNYEDGLLKALEDNYEKRRIADKLNSTPLDELKETQYFGVDLSGLDREIGKATATQVVELSKKYKTTLISITGASKRDVFENGGAYGWTMLDTATYSTKMKLAAFKKERLLEKIADAVENGRFAKVPEKNYAKYVVTHEFGHSILNTRAKTKNFVGADEKRIKKAQNEVKSVYNEYIEELERIQDEIDVVGSKLYELPSDDMNGIMKVLEEVDKMQDGLWKVKISERSLVDSNEFLAEAFTQYELGEEKSIYAERVMKIITNYFGW